MHNIKPSSVSNVENVEKLIKNSPNKHCILDSIPTFLVKQCSKLKELASTICKNINQSIEDYELPTMFKEAVVTPLVKKYNANFKNYRPVSNLLNISKLLEKSISSQMREYNDVNNLNEPLQSA